MAGAKNHDYHILPPSIHPFVGSMSALLAFGGLVMWMHEMPYGGIVSSIGWIGILYTFYAWWSDVVKEAQSGDHTPVVQLHQRYGMILSTLGPLWILRDAQSRTLTPQRYHQGLGLAALGAQAECKVQRERGGCQRCAATHQGQAAH